MWGDRDPIRIWGDRGLHVEESTLGSPRFSNHHAGVGVTLMDGNTTIEMKRE